MQTYGIVVAVIESWVSDDGQHRACAVRGGAGDPSGEDRQWAA
ncbi:hypothetical protein ACWEFL_05840 [Streptomyces sp. NPDC004838]